LKYARVSTLLFYCLQNNKLDIKIKLILNFELCNRVQNVISIAQTVGGVIKICLQRAFIGLHLEVEFDLEMRFQTHTHKHILPQHTHTYTHTLILSHNHIVMLWFRSRILFVGDRHMRNGKGGPFSWPTSNSLYEHATPKKAHIAVHRASRSLCVCVCVCWCVSPRISRNNFH